MLRFAFIITVFLFLLPYSPITNRKKYIPVATMFIILVLTLFTFKPDSEILSVSEYSVSSFSQVGNDYIIGAYDKDDNEQIFKLSKYYNNVKISSNSPKTLVIETYSPTKWTYIFDFRPKIVKKYLLY